MIPCPATPSLMSSMPFSIFARILAATLCATSLVASGQTMPDAGVLQQQIERERLQPLPRPIVAPKPAVPADLQPSGTHVTVREFRFAGNTLLTREQLLPVVAGYLNRPLDFAQLQEVAAVVANAYRDAGWIVRTYLPQQDIHDGIVTIQIVEEVFGKSSLEGEATRISQTDIVARISRQQPAGMPLNADALDRAMLLIDDLPGITVAGTLRAGDREGETDLLLKVADEPFVIGEVSADNAGSRSTGADRLNANLVLASPLRFGDQLTANLIHTRGSDYLRMAYSLPVGEDGWRIGANASRLDYRLVSADFASLNAHGDSVSTGVDASYPIIRSRLQNLFLNLAFDHRQFDNISSGSTTSRYELDSASVTLSGNLFDSLGGGGANSASATWVHGRVNLDGSPNRNADATTARTHGIYDKVRYTASRQQVMTPDVSLYLMYSGQAAGKNLDSSEKFYLGGANGVRAYPANEGGGSKGQMLNLELRWKLPHGLTATAFQDWGRISQNVDNNYAGAPNPNTYSLRGHGLAIGWQADFGLNLKATWAHRQGSNPNPTTTGKDQDGSLDKNRWWLTASLLF